jgi:hypothetical protein
MFEQITDYITKHHNDTYKVTIISAKSSLKDLKEYIKEFGNKDINYLDCGTPSILVDPNNPQIQMIKEFNKRIFDCLHENNFTADLIVNLVLSAG